MTLEMKMVTQSKKLTKRQVEALARLAVEPNSSYGMQVGLGTLWSLSARDLAIPVGNGHIAFPHNGTWQITTAGRAALEAAAG